MPENLQPETMSTWMRDVERRLRAVESRSVPVGMPLLPYFPSTANATVTQTSAVQAHEMRFPYIARTAVHVELLLNITGSGVITLQNLTAPGLPATSTFTFTGTANGKLTFNWDISEWVTIGENLRIVVQALVVNPGDEMVVGTPIGYEADPAFINATTDGNPVFT